MINLKYNFKPSEEIEKAIPAPLDSVENTSIIFESGYQFGNLNAIIAVIKKIRENENELISKLEKISRNFNQEDHQAILELINKNISLIVNFPKTDTVKTREIIDEIECLKIESGLEYDRLWDSTMFNIRAENLKKIRPELATMFRLIRSM